MGVQKFCGIIHAIPWSILMVETLAGGNYTVQREMSAILHQCFAQRACSWNLNKLQVHVKSRSHNIFTVFASFNSFMFQVIDSFL